MLLLQNFHIHSQIQRLMMYAWHATSYMMITTVWLAMDEILGTTCAVPACKPCQTPQISGHVKYVTTFNEH